MLLERSLREQGNYLFRYRSFWPIVLLIFTLVYFFWRLQEGYVLSDPYMLVMYGVSLAGLFIRILTVAFIPDHTSGRNTDKQKAHKLNTTGLYSLTRNPLYVGNYLVWLGIMLLPGSIWLVLVYSLLFWVYYERIVFAEEAYLKEQFGDTFAGWTASTPVFFPRLTGWRSPEHAFQWLKVFREKNTFLSICLTFWLFGALPNYLSDAEVVNLSFWNIVLLVSMVVYGVLKVARARREKSHQLSG